MQGTVRANLSGPLLETPLNCGNSEEPNHEDTNHKTSLSDIDLSSIIQKEITKYIKGKRSLAQALFAHTSFAGITSAPILSCNLNTSGLPSTKGSWVIDTGASNHMCNDLDLLADACNINPPLPIYLPDGRTCLVYKVGQVNLSKTITLTNVLYLPHFNFNLLSVYRLCVSTNIHFHFSPFSCYLQDPKTEEVLDVGKVLGTLYMFDQFCLSPSHAPRMALNVQNRFSLCTASSPMNKDVHLVTLWYRRFGHASFGALKHLPFLYNASFPVSTNCDVCPLAKQSRLLKFYSVSVVWGPYNHECHIYILCPFKVLHMKGTL